MIRTPKRRYWIALVALPLLLGADADYAREWPLTLSRDGAGAYRVTLDDAVYAPLQARDLGDLVVLDRRGAPVPTALFAPEQPLAKPTARMALPWFPLPATRPGDGGWTLLSETDPDGRLRRIEARMPPAPPPSTAVDPAAADAAAAPPAPIPQTTLLVDLSRVREPVSALVLQWAPIEALDLGYRVEASDDLERWTPLATRGRLVDLRREDRRLLHRRIDLYGLLPHYQRARYLRLVPDRTDVPLRITGVEAEFAAAAGPPALRWRELPARRVEDGRGVAFEFALDGPLPVRAADIRLPGPHALRGRLESRADEDAPWRVRSADWLAYAVDAGAAGGRSRPATFPVTRDRHWRLTVDGPVPADPALRLGFAPDVVVFVAQGEGPYVLAAGSARARRADAPLPQLVAAIRGQRGADWQPAAAYLGTPRDRAGAVALAPARDWRTWTLWGVLVLGGLVVAGIALALLRRPRDADPSP